MDGLSKQEVEYRKNNGLANDEKIKYTRTPKQIILSNVITLFNILNIALAVLVLTTGSIQNITFIGTIIVIVIILTMIKLIITPIIIIIFFLLFFMLHFLTTLIIITCIKLISKD